VKNLLLFTEDLIMSPWWVSAVVWAIGNMFIWLVIPGYLAVNMRGGIPDGILTGEYAGVQPLISILFNLGVALFLVISCSYNLMLRKRRGN
jgi:hypothetical protein